MSGVVEKVLEHWLANSTERAFQAPFAFLLFSAGYTVLHITRHSSMELGKDIIAVDPERRLCCFQLKTADRGRIGISQWRGFRSQLLDLVTLPPVHPSIPKGLRNVPHRSFLVTNGEIDEEVSRAIDDWNRDLRRRQSSSNGLQTIVGGEILRMALETMNTVWPSELLDMKSVFELIVENGRSRFPKEKFAKLLEHVLEYASTGKVSLSKALRLVASASMVASLALSTFSRLDNYVAEVDCWSLYLFTVMSYVLRKGFAIDKISDSVELAVSCIMESLLSLAEETANNPDLLEGDPLGDKLLTETRRTHLTGYLSAFYFLRRYQGIQESEIDSFLKAFCADMSHALHLWGESALPGLLGRYFMLRRNYPGTKPDQFLINLLDHLIVANKNADIWPFPNAYYEVEYVLERIFTLTPKKAMERFSGYSYAIEGIVLLLARRLWKQALKMRWSDITKVSHDSYYPENESEYFRWSSDRGDNRSRLFESPTEWKLLREEATGISYDSIPLYLRERPAMLFLFLVINPHRIRKDLVCLLDDWSVRK